MNGEIKVNRIRNLGRTWVGFVLAAALATPALADGTTRLFELAPESRLQVQGGHAGVTESVSILVQAEVLAADEGSESLALPLPGVGARVALRDSLVIGEDGSSVWTGTLLGDDMQRGDVVLAMVDGHVAGVIHAGDRTFRIAPLEGGGHELRPDSGELLGCSAEDPGPSHPDAAAASDRPTPGARPQDRPSPGEDPLETDGLDGVSERILGLSRPEAAAFENLPDPPDLLPQAQLQTQAEIGELRVLFLRSPYVVQDGAPAEAVRKLQIAYANRTYANSGLDLRLVEAGVVTSPFTEIGSSPSDLQRITTDARVNQLRQEYEADLVAFYVRYMESGTCGVGWIPPDNDVTRRGYGFSVVKWGCSNSEVVLVHEIGHNLGARHDLAQDRLPTIHGDYCHGWVDGAARRVTVMAYLQSCGSGCSYVPYFSDPDRVLNGRLLGSPSADNQRCVGLAAATVSSYMPISGRPQPARGLKAQKVRSTSARLKWKSRDRRADYFEVWKYDVDRRVLDLYTTVPVRKKKGKIEVFGLRPGGTYTFIVRVVDRERGVSDRSNLTTFVTRLF